MYEQIPAFFTNSTTATNTSYQMVTFASVGTALHPEATERLMEYWAHGKGALKIRWGQPNDFYRCVKQLRKYFPKDPKGLCANLHHRALGVWPGQEGGGRHATDVESMALLAAAPLGELWIGPLAPIGRMTGDRRIFEDPKVIDFRTWPQPLSFQEQYQPEHRGSVVVGRIMGSTIGPDESGDLYVWGWGDWLPEDVQPKVKLARHLVEVGVGGPSIDADNYEVGFAIDLQEKPYRSIRAARISGATLVPLPAFADLRLETIMEDDGSDDEELVASADCGCGDDNVDLTKPARVLEPATFAVNAGGWKGLSIAAREFQFDNDDAVKRIAQWAGLGTASPNLGKLNQAFMWRDPKGDPRVIQSYRLPVGDIIDGKLVLIYHAIYAAAALISGAHGGLPGISDEDKNKLRNVITDIYAKMSGEFGEQMTAPWDKGARKEARMDLEADTFGVHSSGWDSMPMADSGRAWDAGAARARLDSWAGDDMSKYGRAFLWVGEDPKLKSSYKLPIADVVDGKLTIIPRAVNAVASVLGGGRGGVDIPASAKSTIQGIVNRLQKRMGGSSSMDVETGIFSVTKTDGRPPKSYFEDPQFDRLQKITITDDRRVYGHLAPWGECHLAVGDTCRVAPRSKASYAYFTTGEILTAEGELVPVGRITMGTGHATMSAGLQAAIAHYDNTGTAVAAIGAGEDKYGIWVNGVLLDHVSDEQVQLMRLSPLSGDWRRVRGNLELVAALAVNTAGFPIAHVRDANTFALVASGATWNAVEDQETAEPQQEDEQTERSARLEKIKQSDRANRLARLTS